MLAAGADLLDLGAESTRPAGRPTAPAPPRWPPKRSWRGCCRCSSGCARETDAVLSVDTRKGAVARAALAAGADLINDVSALGDPELAAAVAAAGCPVVLMHSRGEIGDMQRHARFDDVVGEVRRELAAALDRAAAAGIDREQMVLDPGIGFGKTRVQNLALLRRLDALRHARPAAAGRRQPQELHRRAHRRAARRAPRRQPRRRGWAARHGASIVRVHDVAATVQFLAVDAAIAAAEVSA